MQVDEARARDLGALDEPSLESRVDDLGRDLGGRLPALTGEAQRDVRRVVAVLGVARPLERHGRPGDLGERVLEARQCVTATVP